MIIVGLEAQDLDDRTMDKAHDIVSILIVGWIQVLVEQTELLDDKVTNQEEIPATHTEVARVTMDEPGFRLCECRGVHFLQEAWGERHVIVQDDPVWAIHVALDHHVPGSGNTQVGRHVDHSDPIHKWITLVGQSI